MGTLTYDSTTIVNFDDRLLLHLQVVISAKLRRDESFMFSWSKAEVIGGRTSVWIDRRIPIAFDYDTNAMPMINRRWIEELTETTYRPAGLQILPEPGPTTKTEPLAETAVRPVKTSK